MKDPRLWLATVGLLVSAWLVVPAVLPPRPPAPAIATPSIAYVCRESGEMFELPLAGPGADHPVTGRPSLVPAVFDRRQRRWRPGPPLDEMRRRGLLPVAGGPADGR